MARAIQRVAKETVLAFILIGIAIKFSVNWRRALFIITVPLYYLLFQSTMHIEFRYALPMHYFLFVFAAVTWGLVGVVVWNWVVKPSFRALPLCLSHRLRSNAHTTDSDSADTTRKMNS